jgi:hypothetical protein
MCGVFTTSTSEKDEQDALLPKYDRVCSSFEDAVSDEN